LYRFDSRSLQCQQCSNDMMLLCGDTWLNAVIPQPCNL